MHYQNIQKGTFLSRPNRFIAHCEIDGIDTVCHVKNTGRLGELLLPGAAVYLEKANNPTRKTQYDLIAVERENHIVNIDSQAPNQAVGEWLKQAIPNVALIRPETKHGTSRFDFYAEAQSRKIFIEVKGVTLIKNGTALFPDAPSERAVKHLKELSTLPELGYEAWVIFVIQTKGVHAFTPNHATHPAFCTALKAAKDAGVQIYAYDSIVTPATMVVDQPIPVLL